MRILCMIALLICVANIHVLADNIDNIYISVYQPERNEITVDAAKILENKLRKLIISNGIVDEDTDNRFVLTSKVLVVSKDIVPSTPARISEKIEFTFMIGDVEENKVFETYSISSVGIGVSENKALISAVNKLNLSNEEMLCFLNKAKGKIVKYYSDKCEQIVNRAKQQAADRNYDDAIYKLMQIPSVCDCANECQELLIYYYEQRTELNALQLLNEAKALWASSPTMDGASSVVNVLSKIPAGTSIQDDIKKLTDEMGSKLKDDQRKEWAFKLQQYNDAIERDKREYALRSQQQKADNDYRTRQQIADNESKRQTIETCRQIGLEYARNQPKTIVYRQNVILW